MLTRRKLLRRLPLLAAASALAACGRAGDDAGNSRAEPWSPTVRQPLLPSPLPARDATDTPLPSATPGGLALEEFLRLSALLTGFDDLNPALGQVYLSSLQSAGSGATPAQLYERAGFRSSSPPRTVDDLVAAGVYNDEAMGSLADTITVYWYSGIYGSEDNQQVATYVDALVWKAMTFAKPRTTCGPYEGFWREAPPVVP